MRIYAVIDTNVLVSAMLHYDSIPGRVVEEALIGRVIPLLNEEIVAEYENVLNRDKFHFNKKDINVIINEFVYRGIFINPDKNDYDLPDKKDIVFYSITMEARKEEDAYLVTGNIKHFPIESFIVTPREMISIIDKT